MKPRVKIGLVVGGIALPVNIIVAAAMGACGPFVAVVAGALAGWFAADKEQLHSRGEGARAGVVSGLITGALTLVGQLLGALAILVLFQAAGIDLPFGSPPPASADPAIQTAYYVAGVGTGTCFGVLGLLGSTLAGAGAGYLASRPVGEITNAPAP